MLVGFIIYTAIGLLCIILGLLIWKKQKVSLIHEYHYARVKKADIPANSRLVGVGLIILGICLCAAGGFTLFKSSFWWIPTVIGFAGFFILMNKAQRKYNGSWFS